MKAVDEGAKRDALGDGRDIGSAGEGPVPERPVRRVRLEAEFERDAAADQTGQHEHQRQVERAEQHRIGEREGGHQPGAAEHEPSLVAIPHGGDRIDHRVAVGPVVDEWKQHADAEIESVHDHIHHQPEADDDRPEDRKIDAHQPSPCPGDVGSMSGAAESGRAGR